MSDEVVDEVQDEDTTEDQQDEPPAAARRGVRPWMITVTAALLALAVGFAIGVFTTNNHPGEDSPEAGFARDMSVHHSQAVEMGMVAWQRASLQEVRTLGYDIALTQQAQIGLMRGWLKKWGVSISSDQPAMAWMGHGDHAMGPDGRMPGMASPKELEQLRNAQGKQVDILFCQLMTKHHIAGVRMAKAIVARTDDPEVRQLAEGMVNAQQNEIDVLRKLLVKLDADT